MYYATTPKIIIKASIRIVSGKCDGCLLIISLGATSHNYFTITLNCYSINDFYSAKISCLYSITIKRVVKATICIKTCKCKICYVIIIIGI